MNRHAVNPAVFRAVSWAAGLCLVLSASVLRAEIKVVADYKPEVPAGDAKVETVKEASGKDLALTAKGNVTAAAASDPARAGGAAAWTLDGKSNLRRMGLSGELNDNFVAEAYARPTTDEGFRYILQYGSGGHGWSIIRNGKGYQVLLGGKALIGWSGDVPAGQWVHLAVARYDGKVHFFIDGREAGSGDQEPNRTDAKAAFTVGAQNTDAEGVVGDIGRVRVTTFAPGEFSPEWLLIRDPEGKKIAEKNAAGKQTQKEAAEKEAKEAAPGKGDAAKFSLTFDNPPAANGLTFLNAHTRLDNVAGKVALVSEFNSAPEVPWARSVFLTLTDPKFRNGNSPVVDVEVEYRQTFDCPVHLYADTARGSTQVGGGWGRNEGWQKFVVRIDDAKFAGTAYPDQRPDQFPTSGYDLRLVSYASDFAVRSVKIRAYDLEVDPDYRRLLRFDHIDYANPDSSLGDLLVFKPDTRQTIKHQFTNLSKKPVELTWELTLSDALGNPLNTQRGEFTVPPQAAAGLPVTLDTKGLKFGGYSTNLVVTLKKDKQTVLERRGSFAVADFAPVAKAKPGEFLYGLDVGQGGFYDNARFSKWLAWMGVDIVRNGFNNTDDMADVDRGMEALTKQGLQTVFMMDPPKDLEDGPRKATLDRRINQLTAVAKKYPQIIHYELGNEPDLTFFYPGPIAQYARDFESMASAIMQANPKAMPVNGGLSFAGAEAERRSREFIEVADHTKFGGWAYHGHGPGVQAERAAYERMYKLVAAAGKADGKPLVETESGVSALTPLQEVVQARTVVQKMVFGQSVKMPYFLFFRLYMTGENYFMLNTEQEPRPSVLAYANMVRQLRGLSFKELLTSLPDGVEGYAFASPDGTKQAAVLWSNSAGSHVVNLNLAGGGAVKAAKAVDLYGNTATLKPNALGVEVGEDPVFVVIDTAGAGAKLAVIPSPLRLTDSATLAAGGPDTLDVPLKNDSASPLTATLKVTAGPKSGVTVNQASTPVTLAPGQSTVVRVPVTVAAATEGAVEWPRQWAAFLGVDLDKANPSAITDVPATLPRLGGGTVAAVNALPRADKRIDFESLGGSLKERQPAYLIAEVNSPTDQTVTVGASADWWMAWNVNGQRVFDTLANGNGGGYSISDHVFKLPLKKGKNLVTVQVLSGSMGWKVFIGSPDDMRRQTAGADSAVTVSLERTGAAAGSVPDVRRVNVRALPAMPAWSKGDGWTAVADWANTQPDAVLLDKVDNNFAKQPDASKWWKGENDLSARVFTRVAGNALYVVAAVTDDNSKPAGSIKQAEDGDALRLQFADAAGKVSTLDLLADPAAPQTTVSGDLPAPTVNVTRQGNVTLYQIRLDFTGRTAALPQRLNLTAFDSDDIAPHKQNVTLAAPTDPQSQWLRLVWPRK